MSEKTQRRNVLARLRRLDAVAVENPAGPGTPDVNFIGGWIELKWLRRWPRNGDTAPVRIDHFTPQQRSWLLRRHRRGGRVWLLLQVGREWLLFDAPSAAEHVGRSTRPVLIANCHARWENGLVQEEFVRCLTEGSES